MFPLSFKSTADQPFLLKYRKSTEDLASMDHSGYLDIFDFIFSEIVEGETTTNPSAFLDSILKHARFFVIFAVFLLGRFGSNVPLYQWLLCASLIALLFLYLYINHVPFLFLEEDIKWVRRESRFLLAISKDADQVMDLTVLVEIRGKQIFGPSFISGGVKLDGLDETEAAWMAKIKFAVQKAQDLVAAFEKQRIRRNSHNPITFFSNISENFKQVEGLFTENKLVKEEISILMKKLQEINICKSLERSRSNITSLLDRPIIHESDDQQKWVKCQVRVEKAAASTFSIVQKINGLITQDPVLRSDSSEEQMHSINLQLLLLHYFLKDIEGVRFESELEEAWVEEVEEITNEAKTAIHNFLERPPSRNRWLSIIDSWKARRKLKGDITCIEVRFTELLEMKGRYGFKFVRRDSSKFVYQSPPQSTEDDIIISSVVGRIHSYLNEKPNVLGEVSDKVCSLCNQLKRMHKLVDDAGMIERRYNSRMAWLVQMRIIAQRAEKSVGTFMKSSGTVTRSNHLFKTRAVRNLSCKIEQIECTINLLVRSIEAFGIEFREESSSVVGLEEDIRAVVSGNSGLTTNNKQPSVICIVGIEGIGKTTLAKKIYSHGDVVEHFQCRAWVSVPVKSDEIAFLEDVAKQILRSIKMQMEEEEEENRNASVIHMVHDILKDNIFLLVLDNIPTIEEWNTLKAAFPVTSNGSRILLTTRDNKVASQASSTNHPHQLKLRTKEESWKLFIQMVQFPPEEEKRAMKILGKCGGLPLAILRVGYLMSGKVVTTAAELERVISGTGMPLLHPYTTESLEELRRADHLYKCLSYLKLFPTGFEIPARRLIALWIAEGLIKVENEKETYEDVADKYLKELIGRNMIQVVERTLNGKVKSCNLPDALPKHELYMSSGRFSLHVNRNGNTFNHILGGSSNFPCYYSQPLLSILIFDTREGNKPGEEIGFFLQKGIAVGCFRPLLILDLERVFRPELAKIEKLSKLRYLGLRWTCLESLPESIGDLLDLQTLDMKNTHVRTLPSSIWNLQQLRHVYLDQNYRSKFGTRQQGSSSLNNLQTLWGVFMDKDRPLEDGLEKLTNLRKLKLAFQLDSSKQHALAKWIENLKHLKYLRMRSIGEKGEPGDLICPSLSGLHNLSSINLFGKLTPSIIPEFPKTLTDLTLSASSFSDDPMPKLEELSNLKLLCFYSNSFTGDKMTCSTAGFPQLIVLKLWYLVQLKEWNVEEKAMQNLRELEIRSCTNLNVPSGLRHLKTLSELKLTDMPPKFATTIEKTKGQLWDDINHSPAIIAVNWR